MSKKKGSEVTEAKASKWTKAQLLMSNRYKHKKDVLNAVLEDGKEYTVDQADSKIHEYLKGGAK